MPTNNSTGGYNDGFTSCYQDIKMCPSISYDGNIVAYMDRINNNTFVSSVDHDGTFI